MQYNSYFCRRKQIVMLFEVFQSSGHIGIFTHVNPDGDAIGSTLGLYGFLKDLGKECRVFYPSQPSESLEFMIPAEIRNDVTVWDGNAAEAMNALVAECDLIIGLDFNEISRINEWAQPFLNSSARKILIDHHVKPQVELFDTVYSQTEISSTCELLYGLLKDTPVVGSDPKKLSNLTRRSLMTGMITDTNNFANSVYPSTLTMASELLEAGTDRDSIINALFFSYPRRRIEAQGYLLSKKLKITPEGVAYMIMDKCFMNRFHLKEGDTEGFVNIPLSIEGVNFSILLKEERGSALVRVSIRSKKGYSARSLSGKFFHGGGHEQASGGKLIIGQDIPCMDHAEKYIKNSIRQFFNE